VTATLAAPPVSPGATAVETALRLKRVEYKRVALWGPVDAVPGPCLELGGETVRGSGAALAWLDARVPEPPLFPADPDERARVEEAERFGSATLQPLALRILFATLRRRPRAFASYSGSALARIGARLAGAAVVAYSAGHVGADDMTVRNDVRALEPLLATVDAWCEEGIVGNEPPNAADLAIAAPVRLLLTIGDIRPVVSGTRAAALALRVLPAHPGRAPARTVPDHWLPERSLSLARATAPPSGIPIPGGAATLGPWSTG